MAETAIGRLDAKAVKHYSLALSGQTFQTSFFGKNFMSEDGNKPIHRIMKLQNEAGDTVTVDLFNNLTGYGIKGDNELKGNEEALTSATQQFWIDQLRHGVSLGGNMTRQRTKHNLRDIAREKLTIWWSRMFDEALMVYLTGTRGDETGDWLMSPSTVTAGTTKLYGNNTVTAFASDYVMYADTTNSTDSDVGTTSAEYMSLSFLERVAYNLKTMSNKPRPIMMDGKEKYVLILHPAAAYQLRSSTSSGEWRDILKNTDEGTKKIYSGALGEYGPFLLYEHAKVPVVSGGNSGVCYNLLMGAQAGFLAHGNAGNGLHFDWHEEVDDRGAKPVIDTAAVFGVQRSIYDSKDFATMLLKTTNGAATA